MIPSLQTTNCTKYWRREAESNRRLEFCRLLPYHLATAPPIRADNSICANQLALKTKKTADQCSGGGSLYRRLNRELCDQLTSARKDTKSLEQQFWILATLWRIEITITPYPKRLDAAKSKKCNNEFAILILAREIKIKLRKGSTESRRPPARCTGLPSSMSWAE
jgi:hypothetical protein